jgi:hypothetical protein
MRLVEKFRAHTMVDSLENPRAFATDAMYIYVSNCHLNLPTLEAQDIKTLTIRYSNVCEFDTDSHLRMGWFWCK